MRLHLQILTEELDRRIKKNPRYSLRAFAAYLGIHPSALSRVLAGKQELSLRAGVELLLKLNLSKEEKRLFLQSIIEEKRQKESKSLEEAVEMLGLRLRPVEVDPETYARLADLKCLSLVALTYLEGFQQEPDWIARQLEISQGEAAELIELALARGLLERRGTRLVCTNQRLSSIRIEEGESRFLAGHRKSDPLETQEHCGMTMIVDTDHIAVANRMILDFVETIRGFLQSGSRESVFQFSVHMLPLVPSNAGGVAETSAVAK